MNSWSLAGRLAFIINVLLASVWLAASLASSLIVRHEILELSEGALQLTAGRLLQVSGDVTRARPDSLDPPAKADPAPSFAVYQIRDAQGAILAQSASAPERPFAAPLQPGFFDDPTYHVYTAGNADGSVWMQVAESHEELREAVRESMMGLLAPLAVLVLVVAVAVRWIVPRLLASLALARAEIASRGAGNLTEISVLSLPRELVPIVGDVNRLLSRLSTALRAERAFASNSAHELRTPVAAALAQAQVLAHDLSGAARHRIDAVVAALERVAHVVEKLLQLARAEAGLGLSREPVDLGALARVVADSYLRHSRYRDRVRVQTPASSVFVEGDLDTLGIALQNLVDNALAHGGPDVRVTIVVGEDGSLTVSDDGLGVEAEQLATLHQPFVRGSTAAAGSGLGLSIVATIVEQSGGSLRLLSEGKSMGFNAILRLRPIGAGLSSAARLNSGA